MDEYQIRNEDWLKRSFRAADRFFISKNVYCWIISFVLTVEMNLEAEAVSKWFKKGIRRSLISLSRIRVVVRTWAHSGCLRIIGKPTAQSAVSAGVTTCKAVQVARKWYALLAIKSMIYLHTHCLVFESKCHLSKLPAQLPGSCIYAQRLRDSSALLSWLQTLLHSINSFVHFIKVLDMRFG